MIIIKSQLEIKKIASACRIVAEILEGLKTFVKTGISTADIEAYVDREINKRGAIPAFKGYRGYPSSVCISVNEQVCTGYHQGQQD